MLSWTATGKLKENFNRCCSFCLWVRFRCGPQLHTICSCSVAMICLEGPLFYLWIVNVRLCNKRRIVNAGNLNQHATNLGKQVNRANWRRILLITSGTRICWWCFSCHATHSPCMATTADCTLARSEGAARRGCCRNNKRLWLVELVLGAVDGPPLLEVMVRGREEILFCIAVGMSHMLIWIGRLRVTVGDYLVGHRGRVHVG